MTYIPLPKADEAAEFRRCKIAKEWDLEMDNWLKKTNDDE